MSLTDKLCNVFSVNNFLDNIGFDNFIDDHPVFAKRLLFVLELLVDEEEEDEK